MKSNATRYLSKAIFLSVILLSGSGVCAADLNAPLDFWPTERGTLALGWRLGGRPVSGLEVGLLFSEPESFAGIQLSLINHMAGSGFQAGFVNGATELSGLQMSLFNLTENEMKGAQIGLFNDGYYMDGIQFGVINISRVLRGLQIGIANYANEMSGLQIGVVNFARSSCFGIQFGLINLNEADDCDTGALQVGAANCMSQSEIAVFPILRISF